MLVEEILTSDVVTVPVTGTLRDAVAAMLERDTTVCIVDDDGIPSGLVTERGVMIAAFESDRRLADIPLRHFATGFEVVVTPKRTVYFAVGLMLSNDLDIVGVLTQADVMANLTNLTKETAKNLKGQSRWTP